MTRSTITTEVTEPRSGGKGPCPPCPPWYCVRLVAAWTLFLSVIAGGGLASAAARVRIDATQISTPSAVRLSARLSDDAWAGATAVDDFRQREPQEGAVPTLRTEFRVAYDASTLYVKVRAFDNEPERIITHLTRRDEESPGDWLRIIVDSYHDRRTAYEFAVNPSGVKLDRYWFNDSTSDDSWDAVWDVLVSRDPTGWSAEFRIPFSQLRFRPDEAGTFGFAVVRQIGRLKETATWPLLARSATGYVSSFGELGGLTTAASSKRLELTPYSVSNLTTQPTDGNPLLKHAAPGVAGGLDLKYAVTPGLTLTSTINPDFGQVEADPAVVNLTAFETFFAERRPFFVEGSGNFRFDTDCNDGSCTGLFYSRRVGRSPQGTDDLPDADNVHTDYPAQTTILGAAKLTGRVGRFSIGAMNAITQEERADIADGPSRSRMTVEPRTSYSVGRARREFANQSSVGFMVTATNRSLPSDLGYLANSAYTGGVDWDWRFRSRYSLSGYVAGSRISGSPEAITRIQENSRHYFQRPGLRSATDDLDATTLGGTSGRIAIQKIGGQRLRFASNISFKSPGFDANDVGYLRRADTRSMSNWLQVRSDVPTGWFRNRIINFNQHAGWNFDGDRLYSGANVNAHAVFINNWDTGAGFNRNARGFDDRASRGGPGAFVEGYTEGWWYLVTDDRRLASVGVEGALGGDGHGSRFREFNPRLTFRPVPSLAVTAGVRYSRNITDTQWVDTVTDSRDHYVFAHLNQTTVALTGRVSYTLSPTLSLQLYAQPFVSGGDYGGFKELVAGRSAAYAARYAPYAYGFDADSNPDFNVRSFKTTNVLRWEYRPGSTLFVVWQQARDDEARFGDFRFGRDLTNVFRVPARNVFLVKVAYWFSY